VSLVPPVTKILEYADMFGALATGLVAASEGPLAALRPDPLPGGQHPTTILVISRNATLTRK
jgi:hypothetical protein